MNLPYEMSSGNAAPSVCSSDGLLNTKQAAEWLGVTPRFLERRRLVGDGPAFCRLSRNRVGYFPEHLRQWAQGRVKTSTSDKGER